MRQRQLQANKANAKKSTGPRTRVGKARSSKNALRHGLNVPVATLLDMHGELSELTEQIRLLVGQSDETNLATTLAEIELDRRRIMTARSTAFRNLEALETVENRDNGKEARLKILDQLLVLDRYLRRLISRRKSALRQAGV